ncbi:hypothetical protein P171DRAFT_437386 [Karstenula rhodostoma CBS 690.94]|uniref:Uncharacterized protein n=1 Tax=Karstenula rhodostoma CBS 690.94 TaxID=1392251 RepID=A0A9P4P5E6_9PLEO|nr:hypothetical protein P171DRAFT_437386 [Karstenula rhodostoma CBS 690.94]
MTKAKPHSRSGSATVPATKEPTVRTGEILPSGGLALPQHVVQELSSAASTPGTATPASETSTAGGYFAQFGDFTPQVDAGFLNQFNKLALHENWSKREKARRRDEAIETEFTHYFGTDYHDVAKWQELCGLVGLQAEGLSSITKCKKALGARKVMVNLVNLIDHLKNGTPLMKFKNFWEFQRYTLKPGRCMSRTLAKKNAFVNVLLRHVA